MKALRCHAYGPAETLVVEEVEPPSPGPKELKVQVQAAGINFFDTLSIEGKYQTRAELPFSPGSEIAGLVKDVGADVTEFQKGDRVFGSPDHGGMAQEALLSVRRAISLPQEIEFDTAAAATVTYGTSYHALFDRARIKGGETILILGAAGGVGLAAVQLAKAAGAVVIAAASTPAKLDFCLEQGADHVINYTANDLRQRIKEITSDQGLDIVFDPVGGPFAEPALRSLRWGGRFLVIGFTDGEIPKIPLNLPLLKGCSIVGVYWGSFARRYPDQDRLNFDQILSWITERKLIPAIHNKYKLDNAKKAFHEILNRDVMGKIIIDPNS